MRTSLLALLLFGACHGGMGDMDAMRSSIEDARSETLRHLEAARTAATIEDMRVEMDHHVRGMGPMMGDMDMTMHTMMSHCDGMAVDDMRTMHDELDAEMQQHSAGMSSCTELGSARVEVERHAATMLLMMDTMDSAMGHMRCH